MSEFSHHTSCPNCGSSDALAVYDDGHSWCFSCKFFEGPTKSLSQYRKEEKQVSQYGARLPLDFVYAIPEEGHKWLSKYHLSNKEILSNKFGWSRDGVLIKKFNLTIAPLLIFPVFEQVGHLLMWQGRNFGKNGPKYITYGAKDYLHIIGPTTGEQIILTEDLISAIKVGRVTSAMPLWGSSLSLDVAKRLSQRFERAYLWLDKDKAQESFKQAQKLSYLFEKGISCIRTERDPKEYTTEEIEKYVTLGNQSKKD